MVSEAMPAAFSCSACSPGADVGRPAFRFPMRSPGTECHSVEGPAAGDLVLAAPLPFPILLSATGICGGMEERARSEGWAESQRLWAERGQKHSVRLMPKTATRVE